MLSGVQRVRGNEPSHSQVNPHVRSWSPKRTLESSQHHCKGQNSSPWKVIYIIGKLLKRRCLKWARIAHFDIWNTSYGQNKGRESNWQFHSRPLKVGNRPDFLACRWRATYLGKLLTRATTLLQTASQSEVCTRSYAPPKLRESQLWEFRDSHLEVSRQKAIWMWPLVERRKIYYKGKGGYFPKFGPWWVLCVQVARGSS
jgi:hypothetical protein